MFKALLLDRRGQATEAAVVDVDESILPPGDVLVRVEYSSLNYKDALAITGRGAIARTWPLIAGIDLAGTVEHSDHPGWQPGDAVVVNGWGLGETRHGGLAQKARVSSDSLLRVPVPYGTHDTMAIGTAGYTAALCVRALLRHGLVPGQGPVLVTGASGGVGSIAVRLLAGLGFEVHASTGRPQTSDFLRRLGASVLIDREELARPDRPLQSETWAGVVDAVGSHTLVNACARTRWNGAVAACGLAQGSDFPGSVFPFILRGVTLYGINCVFLPNPVREQAWALLATHMPVGLLSELAFDVPLDGTVTAASELLEGRLQKRVVVDVNQ